MCGKLFSTYACADRLKKRIVAECVRIDACDCVVVDANRLECSKINEYRHLKTKRRRFLFFLKIAFAKCNLLFLDDFWTNPTFRGARNFAKWTHRDC